MRKPSILDGAIVGALLTASFIAALFLAWRSIGVPFVPFDLFDWFARVLPGPIVTFGIDVIVEMVTVLGLSLADASKAAEQVLAVAIFFFAGVALGAVLFGLYGARARRARVLAGVVLGLALGLVALFISLSVTATGTVSPLASGFWLLLAFGVWGGAFGWAYDRLSAPAAFAAVGSMDDSPAPGNTAPGNSAPSDTSPGSSVPSSTSVPPPSGAAEAETRQRLDRRRFLIRLGSATAVITVVGTGMGTLMRGTRSEGAGGLAGGAPEDVPGDVSPQELWSQRNRLPNWDAEVEPAPGTRPEFTLPADHYRIDINLMPPTVQEEEWRLRIGGLVEAPLEFTLDQLRSYEAVHHFITLSCISNPLGGDLIDTTRWTGVSMQRLLPDLGVTDDATHLKITSVDGFFEFLSLETIANDERVMLTYQWDGLPLPTENGFPLRIYIPDVYGMKQPKWINRIEAVSGWEAGFWVERGWDGQAQVRATSVIDTIATEAPVSADGGQTLVPVGGIAFAGARGISRVELRVDDGNWQEAKLREPLSGLTWVIWRYDWPFEEGAHTFTVRCFDGNGTPQIAERNPVRPSGATGLLSEGARF